MAADDSTSIPLTAMGCRWILDLTHLPVAAVKEMRRRWSRCEELDADPATIALDEDRVPVVPVPAHRFGELQESDRHPPSPPVFVPYDDHRLHALPYDLSRALTRRGITRLTGRALLLHAAALTDAAGRAVVLVAPSGTGKSTASATLGRHLGYVTDESVVITWVGGEARLAPYPKPPSLIPTRMGEAPTAQDKDERSPDDLGLAPTHPDPVVAAMVTLARSDEADEPRLVEVDLLDQLQDLLPETSSVFALPDGLEQLARAATRSGPPLRLEYREIGDCLGLLRSLLQERERPAPEWVHLPPRPGERLPPSSESGASWDEWPLTAGAVVRRLPWTDAIAHEGRVLVLLHHQPVLLAGLGELVWTQTGTPRSVGELEALAVAAFGEHPESARLVHDAVASLAARGLVVVDPEQGEGV
ncbi:hypothetical protein GCM10022199_25640 [Marihabitans asiaticum]|uniref:Coenzyme PQQ synthesis protein D (PqqD) n=1 Tax=Marihabitans asiaticum TaxID=415218 RepID=A0A560WGS2_9MICO|nr:hypothetical protein [Marihabitans asiaticum]TWD16750.1 hypothetical protein FB557_0286 [Marihabitans asiaticum]